MLPAYFFLDMMSESGSPQPSAASHLYSVSVLHNASCAVLCRPDCPHKRRQSHLQGGGALQKRNRFSSEVPLLKFADL